MKNSENVSLSADLSTSIPSSPHSLYHRRPTAFGSSQSIDLLPINNFKAEENKSYGSALSSGQMLSSKWKQIGHMSPFYCSRRVGCRGILRCRWWFFSLVSQTGCGKHNSVSRYVLLWLKAPSQHPGSASTPSFPMPSEFHYHSFHFRLQTNQTSRRQPVSFFPLPEGQDRWYP